jgi:hypothetical protein
VSTDTNIPDLAFIEKDPDLQFDRPPADQKTGADLKNLLDYVFSHEIYAVGWAQYTPYFNDGSTCIFGVNMGTAALLSSVLPEDEEYLDVDELDRYVDTIIHGAWNDEDFYDEHAEHLIDVTDSVSTVWDVTQRTLVPTGLTDPPAWHALKKLAAALVSGEFDVVLRSNFGEHSKVIATPHGFIVKWYDHD